MPPVGMPRPDRPTYDAVAEGIEASLDAYSAAHPDPGRPVIHRLNRAEYANAMRDLLALEVDVRSLLPADDSGYGFDNISDVLSLSPALLERYMIAAGKISRLAVGERRDSAGGPDLQRAADAAAARPDERGAAVRHARRRGGASLLPGRRRVRDPDPAAANPRQPDSRAGRAERNRGAARPAARAVSSASAARDRAIRGRRCRARRRTSRPPTTS